MKKSLIFTISLAGVANIAIAQKQADTLWQTSLEQQIGSIEIAPDGTLIACGYSTNVGVDPNTGKPKWSVPKIGSEMSNTMGWYPGTPFIEIADHVYNPANGTPVNMGKLATTPVGKPIAIIREYFLYDNDLVLTYGTVTSTPQKIFEAEEQEQVLSLTQLSNGKNLWTGTSYFEKPKNVLGNTNFGKSGLGSAIGKSMGKSMLAQKDNAEAGERILTTPLVVNNELLILPMKHALEAVNIMSGEIVWQMEYPKHRSNFNYFNNGTSSPATLLALSRDGNTLYVSRADGLTALNPMTGKSLWTEAAVTRNIIGYLLPQANGILALPRDENVQWGAKELATLFDNTTGKMLWESSLSGRVINYSYVSNGVALAIEPAMGNQSITVMDTITGKLLLESKYKVRGEMRYMENTPGGLLYMTNKEMNVLSPTTGEVVNKRAFQKDEKAEPLMTNQQDFIILTMPGENYLYKVDKKTGIIAPFAQESFRFQGKELPGQMEIYNDKLLIYSSQNMILYNMDGTIAYQKYFEAPSRSRISISIGGSAAYGSSAPSRFKKTRVQKDAIFVLSRDAEGDLSILGVKKADGSVSTTIPLVKKDRDPKYTIDDVYGYLYYAPTVTTGSRRINGAGNIVAYKLPE